MARNFNGSTDQISAGTGVPHPTGPYTQMAWIYPTSAPNAYQAIEQINDQGNSNASQQMYLKSSLKMAWYGGLVNGGSTCFLDPGTATISLNAWTHVLMRFTGDTITNANLEPFVNGVTDGTPPSNGAFVSYVGTPPYVFGFDNFTANRQWNGRLAHCAYWNVALTNGEIAALVAGALPSAIRPKSLLSYWPFDGLNSPEPDFSGNKNNGTLTGTALAAGPPVMQSTPRWPQQGWTPLLPAAGLGWIINRRNKLMVPNRKLITPKGPKK